MISHLLGVHPVVGLVGHLEVLGTLFACYNFLPLPNAPSLRETPCSERSLERSHHEQKVGQGT